MSKELWYNVEEGILAHRITTRLSSALISVVNPPKTNELSDQKKITEQLLKGCSSWKSLQESWGLPSNQSFDINAPPYQEIPHDFLYKSSLANSYYISIDLKSADFHVLRLAAPELIQQRTWALWVQHIVPKFVKQIPFLGEMKPLRVRVLGKVLHKKNAALQCHC